MKSFLYSFAWMFLLLFPQVAQAGYFSVNISSKTDSITFDYKIYQDGPGFSKTYLDRIDCYFLVQNSNDTIFLFGANFKNQQVDANTMAAAADVTWDGSYKGPLMAEMYSDTYHLNSWSYPKDWTAESLTFIFKTTQGSYSEIGEYTTSPNDDYIVSYPLPQPLVNINRIGNYGNYVEIPYFLMLVSDDEIDSAIWDVEGYGSIKGLNANVVFDAAGTFGLSVTAFSGGYTRIVNLPDYFTVKAKPDFPFSMRIMEKKEEMEFTYLTHREGAFSIWDIQSYYIDPSTNNEVFLFGGHPDEMGDMVDSVKMNNLYGSDLRSIQDFKYTGNWYHMDSWLYPKDFSFDTLKVKTVVQWSTGLRYGGTGGAIFKDSLIKTYLLKQANLVLSIDSGIYNGIPTTVRASSDSEIDVWKWEIEGQAAIYQQNPTLTFDTSGVFDLTLTAMSNGLKTVLRKPDFIKVNASHDLEIKHNFLSAIPKNTPYTTKFTAICVFGDLSYSATNLPVGAVLNHHSGVFSWKNPLLGDYEFTVTASDDSMQVSETIFFSVTPPAMSVAFKVVNNLGEKLENAVLKIDTTGHHQYIEMKTNENGDAQEMKSQQSNINLQINKQYPIMVTYEDWPVYSEAITITKDSTYLIQLNARSLVLQDVTFYADTITKDRGSYTLSGNVNINHLLFFNDGNLLIDNTQDKLPVLSTTAGLSVKGGTINETLLSGSSKKEFYLYKRMFFPREKDMSFNVGDICNIPLNGTILTLYNSGVEFATFPELPWIIGESIMETGYFFRSILLDLIRAGNLDLDGTKEMIETARDLKDEAETDTLILAKKNAPGRTKKLFEKLKDLSISIDKVEVIKYLDTIKGKTQDVTIEKLSITKKGIGLDEFSASYQGLNDRFDCKAHLKWGSDEETRYKSGVLMDDPVQDLQARLTRSFNDYDEMKDVPVIIKDEFGEPIYNTTYDEFIDLTDQLAFDESIRRKGAPISGFGVEFAIINGKIEKMILSMDISIPIPSTGFEITNISGGVDKLTQTNPITGKTRYSTDSMIVLLNCDVEDQTPASIVAFREAGFVVQPFNYFEGSGKLELADKEIGQGKISYDASVTKFSTDMQVNVMDIFTGRSQISISSNAMSASSMMNIKTPSDLPGGFGWVSDRHIGSFQSVFSNKMVGAKVTVGKQVTSYEKVKQRGWWKKVKRAARAVVKAVVYVIQEIKSYLNFDLGIGYDFDSQKVLFGDNVKIPDIRRLCYRGDSLIYEYTVNEDTRLMYVTVTDTSYSIDSIDCELFDVYNKRVGDEVLWFRKENEVIAVVPHPAIGTWTVKVDSLKYPFVDIHISMMNNAPQGYMALTPIPGTTQTEVSAWFNDTNDTLKVSIFLDEDSIGFNGFPITTFKVLNNAGIKFIYTPRFLNPGRYYFYFGLSDGSNIPRYQYAQGNLLVPEGNLAPPLNVKSAFSDSSITVFWNKPASPEVDYVNLLLVDQFSGNSFVKEIQNDTCYVFQNLKLSRSYTYTVNNRSFDGAVSQSVTGDVFLSSSVQNNPPIWHNLKEGEIFECFAMDSLELELNVTDPEDDAIELMVEAEAGHALPGDNFLVDKTIRWITGYDDRGIYAFNLICSDGINRDTVPINILVKPAEDKVVSLEFLSTKLHEGDFMFLLLNEPEAVDPFKTVWLYNETQQDSIAVEMHKVSNTSYQGRFDISYLRRSIIRVQEGDTLVACYFMPDDTAYAFAIFDSIPQYIDVLPPDPIIDLKAELIGKQLQVIYTVPKDYKGYPLVPRLPWGFDVRYAFDKLDNELAYLGSNSLEGLSLSIPEMNDFGKDTIRFDISDLYQYAEQYNFEGADHIANHHRIWLNVKTFDAKYNYSPMSNTVYVDYISNPYDLIAKVTESFSIQLDWKGPKKLEQDNFFKFYRVYRKVNNGDYHLVGKTEHTSFEDLPGEEVDEGMLNYKVVGVYSVAESSPAFSSPVTFDRFTDVSIYCKDLRPDADGLNACTITLVPVHEGATLTDSTNEDGLFYFGAIENSKYALILSDSANIYISDTITVRSNNSFFMYSITGFNDHLLRKCGVTIYPNPVKHKMTINMSEFNGNIDKIRIVSVNGKLITDYTSNSTLFLTVETSAYQTGVYLVIIYSDKGVFTQKFSVL